MAIVLELLSRKNTPIDHVKFEQDNISIGRDFQNDLRLEDPYVCPSHMTIKCEQLSGELCLEDTQSLNGVKVNGRLVQQCHLTSKDIVKIGRTRFRVVDPDSPLPKTILLSELEERLSWLSKTSLAICLTFLYLSFLLLTNYLGSAGEFKLTKALPEELSKMLIFSFWPFTISVLAKVVKKESHIVAQFNLLWLFLLFANGLYLLEKVFIFNFHPSDWFEWLEFVVFSMLLFSFIWFSLFIAFHQTTKRRNTVSFFMSFTFLIPIFAFSFMNKDEFSSLPNYDPTLLPQQYNVTGVLDTDSFIKKADELFSQIDELKNN